MAANGAHADAGSKPGSPATTSAPASQAPNPYLGRAQVIEPPPPDERPAMAGTSFEELAARLGMNADGTPLNPDTPDEDEPATGELIPDADEGDEPDGQEEQAPAPTVSEWAQRIASDPLKHITQVPARDRVPVLGEILRRERENASTVVDSAFKQGYEAAQKFLRVEAAVAEIDALEPAEFGEWARTYPDRAAAYQDFKREQGQPEQKGPDPQAEASRIARLGQSQFTRLSSYPEAQEALKARASEVVEGEPRYAATEAGLQRLIDDVTDALADAKAGRKANDPIRKAADQRVRSAEERRSLVKPDISNAGGGVDGAVTVEQFRTMSVQAHQELAKKDPNQYAALLKRLGGG